MVIKQIMREITPPVILRSTKYLNPLRLKFKGKIPSYLNDLIDVPKHKPSTLAYYTGEPILNVPVHKIRYWGGLPYTYEHHHFMQYYREGISALNRYYLSHQPETIFEEHFLSTPSGFITAKNEQLNAGSFYLPWLFTHEEDDEYGEKGLAKKEGIQAFGPVSEAKIKLEAKRLDSVLKSITSYGFNPEQFNGFPRGYFLVDNEDNWVFLIRVGFHRTAALAHLGYKMIPVKFEPSYPRVVMQSDSHNWPMVKAGYLTEDEALEIFMQYMKVHAEVVFNNLG